MATVLNELSIHILLSEIVLDQVQKLKQKDVLTGPEAGVLERYAKIYGILMTQTRENKKAGVFDDLKDADRKKLSKEL